MTQGTAVMEPPLKPSAFPFLSLGNVFEKVIRSWGADRVRGLPPSPPQSPGFNLERSVALTGTLTGLLVVRCGEEFAEWLRAQRWKTHLGQCAAEEVFEELVCLFCLYLFHVFWRPDSFQIGPLHPYPSIPPSWPLSPPQAACALEVEGHRVELRLWL